MVLARLPDQAPALVPVRALVREARAAKVVAAQVSEPALDRVVDLRA